MSEPTIDEWTHWTIPLDGPDLVHLYFPRHRWAEFTDEDWAYLIENFEVMRKAFARRRAALAPPAPDTKED